MSVHLLVDVYFEKYIVTVAQVAHETAVIVKIRLV